MIVSIVEGIMLDHTKREKIKNIEKRKAKEKLALDSSTEDSGGSVVGNG